MFSSRFCVTSNPLQRAGMRGSLGIHITNPSGRRRRTWKGLWPPPPPRHKSRSFAGRLSIGPPFRGHSLRPDRSRRPTFAGSQLWHYRSLTGTRPTPPPCRSNLSRPALTERNSKDRPVGCWSSLICLVGCVRAIRREWHFAVVPPRSSNSHPACFFPNSSVEWYLCQES